MARIRSIKPEFWDSESVGKASLRARLLFIAMWNWADDYGIGDATPIRLIGFAFPNDELGVADFPPLREEISERFHVVFYKHEGRPYFYIPSWEKHQRTEKRAQQRIPLPSDIENVEITDVSTKVADSPTLSSGTSDAGTGEEGRRKKEQGKKELSRKTGASVSLPADAAFELFWDAYGKKVGRGAAERAWRKACVFGYEEEITEAARQHAEWHKRAGTETRFIPHPSTWLNEKRWTDERTDIAVPRRADGDIDWQAAMERAKARDEENQESA